MARKVILGIFGTFDRRDYERFGIEILQANNIEVEIWNFLPLLNPKGHELLKEFTQAPPKGYTEFSTTNAFQSALLRLPAGTMFLFSFEVSPRTALIFKLITKTSFQYGFVSTSAVPDRQGLHIKNFFSKLLKLSPSKIYSFFLSRSPFLLHDIKPPSLIIAGGTKSVNPRYLRSRETHILWAHSMDYDVYLSLKDRPMEKNSTSGVFIDAYLPFHQDNIFGGLKPFATPEFYYSSLKEFFYKLEDAYKVRIIIAAHPRSDYGPSNPYFGTLPVIYGETADLVRKSKFVLNHYSTAVNFAVLYNKPVLFISTDEIERSNEMPYLLAMARMFHKEPMNIDNAVPVDWLKEMTLDSAAYALYKELFIKKSGSPEKPLWQIVADYIKTQG